jgi:hypothetical protein
VCRDSLLRVQEKNLGPIYFDTYDGERIAAKSPLYLLCALKNEPNIGRYCINQSLILRPSNARPGSYRRVGLVAWCDASIFDDAPDVEVVIV